MGVRPGRAGGGRGLRAHAVTLAPPPPSPKPVEKTRETGGNDTRFDASSCSPLRPLHPRLRSFPSAAPLRPLLRSLFSYSEGRRGVADGKRRSRRGSALLWSAERSAVLSGALMKPVQAGARGGWRLIGRVRWSPWPGGRRGRSSRARRSSATDPERVGGLGGPHRIPILALWEDRSAPHPATSASQPRNHAEIAERIRGAGPNDPPRAPYPAPGGLRGSLLRLMGPRDPCGSGRGDAARPHPERPTGGPRRRGPGRRRGGKTGREKVAGA